MEWIEHYRDREYWELRRILGVAIGRLGIYHKYKLIPVLEKLAKHQHGGVVSVVGDALGELCRTGIEYHSFVTGLLEKWVDSGDPDFMWAVAASIWRIYNGLMDERLREDDKIKQALGTGEILLSILTTLAENYKEFSIDAKYEAFKLALEQIDHREESEPVTFREFIAQFFRVDAEIAEKIQQQLDQWAISNLRAIVHASYQIALNHSKALVKQIITWMNSDKDGDLFIVGKIVTTELFRSYSTDEIQLLEERHLPLLDLIKR